VEAVPAGFKVERSACGETFYCKACDRPEVTTNPKSEKSTTDVEVVP